MPRRIGNLLKEIRKQLSSFSNDIAGREAEQIIEHTLGLSRSRIYTDVNYPVNKEKYDAIVKIVKQRLTGIPLPYILGFVYFYSKKFCVSPEVIIPRPDTEILVEIILKNETSDTCTFIDIGTGSGIIAETLVQERPSWHAFAADLSISALKIAKRNCSERVLLFCSDKLSAVTMLPVFDFIVSNPPYISKAEMEKLDRSVTDYEPFMGLNGGVDGLDFYRYIAQNGKSFIKSHGRIYCEIGSTQEMSVKKIFQDSGWTDTSIHNDLAERPRVIVARKI
jgi:release factor glutamine methyltransferase